MEWLLATHGPSAFAAPTHAGATALHYAAASNSLQMLARLVQLLPAAALNARVKMSAYLTRTYLVTFKCE